MSTRATSNRRTSLRVRAMSMIASVAMIATGVAVANAPAASAVPPRVCSGSPQVESYTVAPGQSMTFYFDPATCKSVKATNIAVYLDLTPNPLAPLPLSPGNGVADPAGFSGVTFNAGLATGSEQFTVGLDPANPNTQVSYTFNFTVDDTLVPGPPQNLVATGGVGKIDLTWSPPLVNPGSVFSYCVYYTENYLTVPDTFLRCTASTSMTDSGLAPNVNRVYFVKARATWNPQPLVDPSALAGASTEISGCATILAVGSVERTRIDIPSRQYFAGERVTVSAASPTSAGTPTSVYLQVPAGSVVESHSFPGSVTYLFAANTITTVSYGVDSGNATLAASCATSVPEAPVAQFAMPLTTTTAQVWFTGSPVVSPPVTRYEIQSNPAGGTGTLSQGLSDSTMTATVSGLQPGTSYTFRVRAVSDAGASAWSNYTVDAITTCPCAPGAPVGVSATGSDGQISLAWSAPGYDGGAALSGYGIEYSDVSPVYDPSSWLPLNPPTPIGPEATSYVDVLPNGTYRWYRVFAVNEVGPSNIGLDRVGGLASDNYQLNCSIGGAHILDFTVDAGQTLTLDLVPRLTVPGSCSSASLTPDPGSAPVAYVGYFGAGLSVKTLDGGSVELSPSNPGAGASQDPDVTSNPWTQIVYTAPQQAEPMTSQFAVGTGVRNGTSFTIRIAVNAPPTPPTPGGGGTSTPDTTPASTTPVVPPTTLQPGEGSIIINGVETPVVITKAANGAGLVVTGAGVSFVLASVTSDGTPIKLAADGSLVVNQGGGTVIGGTGFDPKSTVVLYLHSDPILLGTVPVNAKGELIGEVPMPANIPTGNHTLEAIGTTPSGQSLTLELGVTVVAPLQASTAAKAQTARITAPVSGRFTAGSRVVLAAKAVKTDAGVTVRWSRTKASAGVCSVATTGGRAVATMLKPGTCTVVGNAAAPSGAYAAFQTTRTYRVR